MGKRRGKLGKRYGHFGMKEVEGFTDSIKSMATKNPAATAGILGASAAAIAAGMGVAPAAMLGAGAAIVAEKVTKK